MHGEFVNIKSGGCAPSPRFGHTMSYLPVSNSILVVGGRNDELCKVNITPLLNDMFLFLLDQKVWIQVKNSWNSEKMDFVGNHCMSVVTDGESYERILLFGGITNVIKGASQPNSHQQTPHRTKKDLKNVTPQASSVDMNKVMSFISNRHYVINVQQRANVKSFFKEESFEKKKPSTSSNPNKNNDKL